MNKQRINLIEKLQSQLAASLECEQKSKSQNDRLRNVLGSISRIELMKTEKDEYGTLVPGTQPISDDQAFMELCRVVGVAQGAAYI